MMLSIRETHAPRLHRVARSVVFWGACSVLAMPAVGEVAECTVSFAQGIPALCYGDCNRDGDVTVDEMILVSRLALGTAPYADCALADESRDGVVTVDELVGAVVNGLEGCAPAPNESDDECPGGREFCNVAGEIGLDALSFGKGAAFVDVDGDDFDDIWASDSDQRQDDTYGLSRLYRNMGDGTFAPMDLGIDSEHLRYNWAASFADYDNDGDPDVLLVNGGFAGKAQLYLYRNDLETTGAFTDVSAESGISRAVEQWFGASWADYDGDGLLDVVVVQQVGRVWLYRGLGEGRFEDVTAAARIDPAIDRVGGQNPVWFDYDDDGDLDLYLAGTVKPYLYENRGDGTFDDVSHVVEFELTPPLPVPGVFAAAAADFDQDGRDDLYLGRWTLQDYVFLNRGGGRMVKVGRDVGLDMAVGGQDDFENTMGLAVGDIDNDGAPDVLIGTGNPSNRYPDLVFCNHLDGRFGFHFSRCSDFVVEGHGGSQTHGIALGDPDRDGDTDIFFSIGGMAGSEGVVPAPGSHALDAFYRSAPTETRNTVFARLEGTTSNRDAIGATIRVDGSDTHYARVRSTQGFQSQNSAWKGMTLGAADHGTLAIRWPSGAECEVRVFSGDRIRITE